MKKEDRQAILLLLDPGAKQMKPKEDKRPKIPSTASCYVEPNPDESRKNCINCALWVTTKQCILFDPDENITANHICNYHVYGKPMKKWVKLPGLMPLAPEPSGLAKVKDGTACENCEYYDGDEDSGKCLAVYDADDDDKEKCMDVEALGCCALWEEMDDEDDDDEDEE